VNLPFQPAVLDIDSVPVDLMKIFLKILEGVLSVV